MSPTPRPALSRAHFATALASHQPKEVSSIIAPSRAAIAAVLREGEGGPEVLLMERAHRAGDRWSGQVSLPGGRAEPHDRDLLATALRETEEEVGLHLETSADLLGRLDDVHAMAKAKLLPMAVTPFVFAARDVPMAVRLSHEATEAFWFPLGRASCGELDGTHVYTLGPTTWDLPCWRFEGHTVWGLTHKVLRGLLALASTDHVR